jgi:hypothetical protein
MRQLTFEIVREFYEAIWPHMPIKLADGTAIGESQISMIETWEICDWAEGLGFDTEPLRRKVIDYLATFDLKPPVKLRGSQLLAAHPEDGQIIVEKIDRKYGWGTSFNSEQINTLAAPIDVAMPHTSRNNGVINICLAAMADANMIPSDLSDQQKYREMLESAFSQHLAILWSAEDVIEAMKDEDDYEADIGIVNVDTEFINDVFELACKQHDCTIGINREYLRQVGEIVQEQNRINNQNDQEIG